MNILQSLQDTAGLTLHQIEKGIVLRASTSSWFSAGNKPYLETPFNKDWLENESLIPEWASRAAASWLIELWMLERDAAEASKLLQIDNKYTRMLKQFTLSEIIAMRNELLSETG